MGLIVRPNTYVPGTIIRSAEVNDDFDTIYNEFNGFIDINNVSSSTGTGAFVFQDNPTINGLTLNGGTFTGIFDASAATWTDLGLVQDVDITGGTITGMTIDNSVIGGITPAAGTFTTLDATENIRWMSGTAFWGELDHANTGDRVYTYPDATGNVPSLPTAATTETGSGAIVRTTAPTLVNAVLTTPFIGDFTNAQHDHTSAAGGGALGPNTVGASQLVDTLTWLQVFFDPNGAHTHQTNAQGGQISPSAINFGGTPNRLAYVNNLGNLATATGIYSNGTFIGINSTTASAALQVEGAGGTTAIFTGPLAIQGIQILSSGNQGATLEGATTHQFHIRPTTGTAGDRFFGFDNGVVQYRSERASGDAADTVRIYANDGNTGGVATVWTSDAFTAANTMKMITAYWSIKKDGTIQSATGVRQCCAVYSGAAVNVGSQVDLGSVGGTGAGQFVGVGNTVTFTISFVAGGTGSYRYRIVEHSLPI